MGLRQAASIVWVIQWLVLDRVKLKTTAIENLRLELEEDVSPEGERLISMTNGRRFPGTSWKNVTSLSGQAHW